MKKNFLLVALLACAVQVRAAQKVNANTMPEVDGRDRPIYNMVPSNPSGTPLPTPVPGGSNVVLNGISGGAATSYFDKLSTAAAVQMTPQPTILPTPTGGYASQNNQSTANAALSTISTYLGLLTGSYYRVSATSATGVTANAGVTRSLTHLAGTATGNFEFGMVGCAGVDAIYYYVHDGATPTAFFTANPSQGYKYTCGTTNIFQPKFSGARNTHVTIYASAAANLSATSATVSYEVLSKTAN